MKRINFYIHCFDRELVIELENEPDFTEAKFIINMAYDEWCNNSKEVADMCCEEYICSRLKEKGIKFTWINEENK